MKSMMIVKYQVKKPFRDPSLHFNKDYLIYIFKKKPYCKKCLRKNMKPIFCVMISFVKVNEIQNPIRFNRYKYTLDIH